MLSPMRFHVFAVAVGCFVGCESKQSKTEESAPKPAAKTQPAHKVQLTDLDTTLAPVRMAFNAKRGEARFLTLLSPT